ncbi:hypothetical protein L596_007698 [Steinernema carpocapsae]|uniref:Uncharacterized protein n=1 Tax=Steinernema carpocapsae TaxID=34508 RepID=A0A4U5PAR1_STECR|nr:hypothetical protein L596_007698 [Steinernema carpocapsae]
MGELTRNEAPTTNAPTNNGIYSILRASNCSRSLSRALQIRLACDGAEMILPPCALTASEKLFALGKLLFVTATLAASYKMVSFLARLFKRRKSKKSSPKKLTNHSSPNKRAERSLLGANDSLTTIRTGPRTPAPVLTFALESPSESEDCSPPPSPETSGSLSMDEDTEPDFEDACSHCESPWNSPRTRSRIRRGSFRTTGRRRCS